MTFSAAAAAGSLDLGKLLKILQDGMVYNQLSTASEMWKHVLSKKTKADDGRQYNYEIMTAYGPSAVQFTGMSSSAMFPQGQKSSLVEAAAIYKDIDLTIEYDLTLEKRSGSNLLAYARPLAHEMEAKGLVAARLLSAAALGDGSGAIGLIGAIDAVDTNNVLYITLDTTSSTNGRSHIGWFEVGDIIKFASSAGAAHALADTSAGAPTSCQVVSVDVENNKIGVSKNPNDSLEIAEDGAVIVGDYIYRLGTTPQDLNAISTNDYNTLSEVMVGLESLLANDGRKVNGITMSGVTGASRKNLSGALLNSKDFQSAISLAKRRTGNKYKYAKAFMHDQVLDAMVELANADKQFFNVVDFTTGARKIGHQHGKDFVEFIPDEFIPKKRVVILPEDKGVLEFIGRDFEQVKIGGQSEFLKGGSTAGRYAKQGQKFMSASGCMVAKHPAGCIVLENFVIS